MTSHRPSRWLAPLALLAALAAVLFVVSGSTKDEGTESSSRPTTDEQREAETGRTRTGGGTETGSRTSTGRQRKTYTVQSGDTLAAIAERTDVPVEEILQLNPDIDPNSLTVGDKIKLTE